MHYSLKRAKQLIDFASVKNPRHRSAVSGVLLIWYLLESHRASRAQIVTGAIAQNDHVADSMPAWLGLSMELALVTGQQLGDISRLKWEDVREGRIWIVQEKTGARVSISTDIELIQARLHLNDILARCELHYAHCVNIIANQAGRTLAASTISMAFTNARRASGIKWEAPPLLFTNCAAYPQGYTKKKGARSFLSIYLATNPQK